MSTRNDWDQRRYRLEASVSTIDGAQTVFVEHMTPGTTVPPHYHTRFSETFDLISGSMKVYRSSSSDIEVLETSAQSIGVGEKLTIPPGLYHKYIAGNEPTTLRVIITPGDEDFERLLKILVGMGEDNEFMAYKDSPLFTAVLMDLANAHVVGPTGDMLDSVRAANKEEIEALRLKLIAKYDTNHMLEKLMAP